MRFALLPPLVLLGALMSGCVDDPAPTTPEPMDIDVYRFAWPGSDTLIEGYPYGTLFRVVMPDVAIRIAPLGVTTGIIGVGIDDTGASLATEARIESGDVDGEAPVIAAPAGTPFAVWMSVEEFLDDRDLRSVGIRFTPVDGSAGSHDLIWQVSARGDAVGPVMPSHHVMTKTVGVWLNGTSFYTNIAQLQSDDEFPRGYAADFPTDDLPVYVYGSSRDEQPEASKDACFFTTIEGYNALLQSQSDGSVGVRYLPTAQAYEGADNHLDGDDLVFLNHVTLDLGTAENLLGLPDPVDLPNPAGPCFPDRVLSVVASITP